MTLLLAGLVAVAAIAAVGCKSGDDATFPEVSEAARAAAEAATAAHPDNPFFHPYGTPFNVPPFDRIKNDHFLPAVEEGIRREQAEVDAIVANPKKPTFANTIAALDHAGIFLSEVTAVFGSLQSALTSKEIQAIAQKTAPMLAAHGDNIGLNPELFARVKAVYDKRNELGLDRESLFLLENAYKDFVRGGALLDESQKTRLRELNQELSLLSLKFGENVLAETNAFQLVIDRKADLAGGAAAKPAAGGPVGAPPPAFTLSITNLGSIKAGGRGIGLVLRGGQTLDVGEGDEIAPGYKVVGVTAEAIVVEGPNGERKTFAKQGDRP